MKASAALQLLTDWLSCRPQHEPIRSLEPQPVRERQSFTPNPPNTVNQARISLPPAGANGARPGHLIQGSSKSLLYPNQRNVMTHEDFHTFGSGGRSNPDVGMDIERNVSRTSSRASARERLQYALPQTFVAHSLATNGPLFGDVQAIQV